MTSRTTADFRKRFAALPKEVREQARAAFAQFKQDPSHPSLRFKKIVGSSELWSARVNKSYRAVGRWRQDVLLWFFIGSHADYDEVMRRS